MIQDILTKEESLVCYRKLLLTRLAEEKIAEEYFKDEMKTPVHLGVGGEAIPVGVSHCLPPGTKSFGTYRNHALYLTLTEDTDRFFAEMYGKVTGPGKGKAGSMHLSEPAQGLVATSAVVGTTIPVAVGAALANQYRGSQEVVAVYFGDGALEEGVFWESLNFASLRKLPVLFVCEDNDIAVHTATRDRQGFSSILKTAATFECYTDGSEGFDLPEVITATRRVLGKMEKDLKPGFLRFRYFRYYEHVGPREDFDVGYRRRPSPQDWERMDPVVRFEKQLLENSVKKEELSAIRESIREKIARSVVKAKEDPFPTPDDLYKDVTA